MERHPAGAQLHDQQFRTVRDVSMWRTRSLAPLRSTKIIVIESIVAFEGRARREDTMELERISAEETETLHPIEPAEVSSGDVEEEDDDGNDTPENDWQRAHGELVRLARTRAGLD